MKISKSASSKVLAACLSYWGVFLLLMVTPGATTGNNSLLLLLTFASLLALPLTFVAALNLFFSFSASNAKNEKYSHSPLAKTLAVLIVCAILLSTYTAIKSFWYSPTADNWGDRFIYENIATGTGFAGIVLTIILSAIQADIYWVTRRSRRDLDERQLHDRREVFETSYKLGAFIILAAAWWLGGALNAVPTIMANNYNSLPGHLGWIGGNLTVTMFALPLLVAAWKKQ